MHNARFIPGHVICDSFYSLGFLRFVSLNDIDVTTHTLPRGDNHFGSVQTDRIPFGNTAVYSIYVSHTQTCHFMHSTVVWMYCEPYEYTTLFIVFQISTNGYFSMGERPQYNSVPNFPVPNDGNIVAPYGADIDTSTTGSVRYADFSQFSILDSRTTDITNFIRTNTLDDFFRVDSMVVAEWNLVHHSNGQYVSFYGDILTPASVIYSFSPLCSLDRLGQTHSRV